MITDLIRARAACLESRGYTSSKPELCDAQNAALLRDFATLLDCIQHLPGEMVNTTVAAAPDKYMYGWNDCLRYVRSILQPNAELSRWQPAKRDGGQT